MDAKVANAFSLRDENHILMILSQRSAGVVETVEAEIALARTRLACGVGLIRFAEQRIWIQTVGVRDDADCVAACISVTVSISGHCCRMIGLGVG